MWAGGGYQITAKPQEYGQQANDWAAREQSHQRFMHSIHCAQLGMLGPPWAAWASL